MAKQLGQFVRSKKRRRTTRFKIRECREVAKLTRRQLAERLDVAETTLYRWERFDTAVDDRDAREPDWATLVKIAGALAIEPLQLLPDGMQTLEQSQDGNRWHLQKMKYPNRIRFLRERQGMSQVDLARALETSQQQVSRYEKGEHELTVDWMRKFSEALGVQLMDLISPQPLATSVDHSAQSSLPEDENQQSKASIGKRLELVRQILDKNQQTFALEAGIATNTFNQYESGTNRPSLEEAHKLCDRWGLTLDWIYRGDTRGLSADLVAAIEALLRVRNCSK